VQPIVGIHAVTTAGTASAVAFATVGFTAFICTASGTAHDSCFSSGQMGEAMQQGVLGEKAAQK
jgi:hypothetical protein